MNKNNYFLIIGHSGAKAIAPENSLKAFQKAIELKADFIEFDLRLSKDGEIIIMHDEDTIDVTGHNRLVYEMTLKELKQLDIGGGEKVATLTELIKLTKGKIGLLSDIKVPGVTLEFVNILKNNGLIDSSIASCFEVVELLKIKEIEPSLKLGYLIPRALTYKRIVRRYVQRAIKNEFYAIHPNHQIVDRDFVKLAHDGGLKINVWTVNEESLMRKLIDLDVDGIMTDDIALLNQVIGRSY